jgi:long-chain acyl-CoA synthetase
MNEEGIGEIMVKGDTVMLGYYENEEATKEVLSKGWFRTGDLGRIDEDGFIYITGRKKDVIVLKNGKKVFTDELEFLVKKIPGVEEVFVYGRPDEEDENDLMVCVKIVYVKDAVKELYGDITEEELHEKMWDKVKEINKTLPKYKYIKGLIVTDVPLIKTTTNKVKRNEELKLIMEQK